MRFENTLPEGFQEKARNELGKTKERKAPCAKFGRKTAGETPMSQVEEFFCNAWAPLRGIRILAKEPLQLYVLGGAAYTPDFLVATEDGIALVEVKSENPLPNEGRAIEAFADASRRNPQIEFWWARQVGVSFDVKIWRNGKCESR